MADLRSLGDELHISISQIKAYLRCPRSFALKYVEGVRPLFKPVPFAFGSAFHRALETFYLGVKEAGSPPALDVIQEEFRTAWKKETEAEIPLQVDEDDDDDKDAIIDKGIEMLGVFHDSAVKSLDGVKVEAVEQPFSVPLVDPDSGDELEERLVGVLDLVVKKGRKRKILEHKTAARRYGEDQIRFDIQPTGYQLAAKAMGLGDVGVTFQVVTKARSPQLQVVDLERTPEDEAEFVRIAIGVMRGVDAGAFPPVRSWACRTCPYQHVCRPSGRK